MGLILSVQSYVAYGYVGNRAALIPLNALGHEVIALNTVYLSNHRGYDDAPGTVMQLAQLEELTAGIKARGLFPKIDAVLTGYIGGADIGEFILDTLNDIRSVNENCMYCCDPVMGDTDPGFYVEPPIKNFFKNMALAEANMITPNQFEASYLSGVTIETVSDLKKAFSILHKRGIDRIVITSITLKDSPDNEISMAISSSGHGAYLVTTPKIKLDPMPNGAGDTCSATLLGRILNGDSDNVALERTASAIFDVFSFTQNKQRRELDLVHQNNPFLSPNHMFNVELL